MNDNLFRLKSRAESEEFQVNCKNTTQVIVKNKYRHTLIYHD